MRKPIVRYTCPEVHHIAHLYRSGLSGPDVAALVDRSVDSVEGVLRGKYQWIAELLGGRISNGNRHSLTPDVRDRVLRLHAKGELGVTAIGRECGVSHCTVAGIIRRDTEASRTEMLKLAKSGKTVTQISRTMKVTRWTVTCALAHHEPLAAVPRRERVSEWVRKWEAADKARVR